VLDLPPAVVRARNAGRPRVVDADVVTRHRAGHQRLDRLRGEEFTINAGRPVEAEIDVLFVLVLAGDDGAARRTRERDDDGRRQLQQRHVGRVEADGRIVDEEERAFGAAADGPGELAREPEALGFAARERVRGLPEREVAEAYVRQGAERLVEPRMAGQHGMGRLD